MKYIQTVTGPVQTDRLGKVLMHEHLVGAPAGIAENYPELYGKDKYKLLISDLTKMKENGIATVVDCTPFDLGRNIKWMISASKETGMNIIASTGFFLEPSPMLGYHDVDEYADCFVREIEDGIQETGARAGMLKTAMDSEGPTKGREIIHRAVARTSVRTGCPITLHSYPHGRRGIFQLKWMKEEGVPMNRIILDHCLDTSDFDYLSWVYDQGVYLGCNRIPDMRFPNDPVSPPETRYKIIKEMIDRGWGDRMLFSHDFQSVATLFQCIEDSETRKYVSGINPMRFEFLQKTAFPALNKMGIPLKRLEEMLSDNPRRFFEEL